MPGKDKNRGSKRFMDAIKKGQEFSASMKADQNKKTTGPLPMDAPKAMGKIPPPNYEKGLGDRIKDAGEMLVNSFGDAVMAANPVGSAGFQLAKYIANKAGSLTASGRSRSEQSQANQNKKIKKAAEQGIGGAVGSFSLPAFPRMQSPIQNNKFINELRKAQITGKDSFAVNGKTYETKGTAFTRLNRNMEMETMTPMNPMGVAAMPGQSIPTMRNPSVKKSTKMRMGGLIPKLPSIPKVGDPNITNKAKKKK